MTRASERGLFIGCSFFREYDHLTVPLAHSYDLGHAPGHQTRAPAPYAGAYPSPPTCGRRLAALPAALLGELLLGVYSVAASPLGLAVEAAAPSRRGGSNRVRLKFHTLQAFVLGLVRMPFEFRLVATTSQSYLPPLQQDLQSHQPGIYTLRRNRERIRVESHI